MPEDKNNIRLADPKELLRNYQSGVPDFEMPDLGRVNPAPSATAEQGEEKEETPFRYADYVRARGMSNDMQADYTQEAKEAGYGLSRYDDDFAPGMDLEQNRALEQSNFAKIGSGLLKGGVTAAATAVNTTLGTVFGLGSAMYELAADANGNGRGIMDTIDAGTNNWLSNQLVKLQNWSEEVLPNYRTQEERSEQYQKEWYKHMGTANFIGDSILKNFGFTVGAMAGGVAWSRLIGAGLAKQVANNVMKGAVVAAEGNAEATALLKEASASLLNGAKSAEAKVFAERAVEAMRRGTASAIDAEKLVKNVEAAAKSINKMNAKLQLYGAAIGAMGEGTVEGIMAKNEFLDDYKRQLQDMYKREYDEAEQDIMNSRNYDWVTYVSEIGPDGKRVDTPRLTQKGQQELDKRRQQADYKYLELSGLADGEAERLASTTFLLNLPILTTSNLVQFGRMFAGGWKTSRAALSGITGGVTTNAGKVVANYGAKGSKAGMTILNSLKVMGSESFEEMAQGTVSSGAKKVAGANLTAFNDMGYDAEAIGQIRDWFYNMYTGGKEYLGDIKNWQEGALGALTGLFGIPGRRWGGGVIGAYQEANEEINARRNAASELNSRINSQEFQDAWHNYIRHQAAGNRMEEALKNDDKYAWHTESDLQLIGDIMMFSDAGKLDDLKQIVTEYANMSDEDVKGIRDMLKDDKNGSDWTKNLSDAEVISKVRDQASDISKKIDDYKNVYEALRARAPIGASRDFLKEMTYTAMQIKSFDERFLSMFGEVMEAIDPFLLVESTRDEEGKTLSKEESAHRYQQLRDTFERAFGSVIPVGVKQQIIDSLHLEQLENLVKDDKDTVEKVQHMRQLMQDRKDFYRKLQTLQQPNAQKKFEEQATTQQKVEEEAAQAQSRIETQGLDSLDKVKVAYINKNAKERAEFLHDLAAVEDSNPNVKQFMELKRKVDGFLQFIDPMKDGILANAGFFGDTSNNRAIESAIDDFLRRAKDVDELANLPDKMFMTFDEFKRDFQTILGPPTMAQYNLIKESLRSAMKQYMGVDDGTASRNTISPEPVESNPAPGTTSAPENTLDPAQPSSVQPAPAANPTPAPAPAQTEPVAPAQEPQQPPVQEPAPAVEPAPQEEEQQPVPETNTPEPEEVAEDAVDVYEEEVQESVEEETKGDAGSKKLVAYYRTSVPEISTTEAKRGRFIRRRHDRQAMMGVDLSDFLVYLDNMIKKTGDSIAEIDEKIKKATGKEKEDLKSAKNELKRELSKYKKDRAGYDATWSELNQRKAFENVAKILEPNDMIEFYIDPNFPPYNGNYQILLTVVKNGKRYVLNTLSAQTDEYYGLYELRRAIDAEYQQHIKNNPNDPFVFSKKSRVFAKRDGLVEYDYKREQGKYTEEKGIKEIRSYDENMPIAFIDRNGNAVVINGKDKAAVNKVSPDFNDPVANMDQKGRVGNLYYLSYVGDNKYVPIRLWVEHFRNPNQSNPIFDKIKGLLTNIANLTKSANEQNFAEKHQQMLEKLKELGTVLNIGGYNFQIGNFGGDVGVALRMAPADDNQNNTFRRADQITPEWLINHIASLGLSLQIKLDEDGNMPNIQQYIDNDLITSNAKTLHPKGMDFYFVAWDDKAKDFVATPSQQQMLDEASKADTYEKPNTTNESNDDIENHPVVRAALTSFKGFPEGVTEVGYVNQDKFPFIRFEKDGRKFMFTFNINTKGKVTPYLLEQSDNGLYYQFENGTGTYQFEQAKKAADRYIPEGFIEMLQKFEEDNEGTIDEREERHEQELRERFGIYYLNATLLGTEYEENDPGINRIKRELLNESNPEDISDDDIEFDREDFGDFNEDEEVPEPAPVAEEGVDYQAKAVEEHAKEINEKFVNSMSNKIQNVPSPYTLAKIITIMASQGASRYAALVKAMTDYFAEDKPIANRLSDWKTIFNSIFTKEEKQALHDALSRKLGIDASEASAYFLMEDYRKRRLIPSKAEDADWQTILDAFTRMSQTEDNLDIVSAVFTPAYATIGMKDDSFDSGEDVGVLQDLSKWENIPASIQAALQEKKCLGKQQWSKEEWESEKMTDSLRDQALRCATVG